MKIILLLLFFSNAILAGDFYYMKNNIGWVGPYESLELPKDVKFDCKTLLDNKTGFPFDKRLMKTKPNKDDLICDENGFAQLKIGTELSDANKEIDDDKIKENAKDNIRKNIESTIISIKTIICKDHPKEDICK